MAVIYLPCYIYIAHKRRKDREEAKKYNRPRADIKPYSPPKPRKAQARAKSTNKPTKPKKTIHADTIAALYAQADAELMLSNALDEKAKREKDPIKSATLYKRAAACMVRCNTILDNINKLESSE